MGLTVHFTLRLPVTSSPDEVTARIAALHRSLTALPFQGQTSMAILDEARICQALVPHSPSEWRWACVQYSRYQHYRHDSMGIPYAAEHPNPGTGAFACMVPAKRLIGFTCQPGEGCEPMNIFVGTYPDGILVDGESPQAGKRRLMLSTPLAWTGHAFTKTQYASLPEYGGVTNFLRCHLLVIAALDAAKAVGFEIEVDDEGGYWDDRDVQALVRQIGDWNAFILGVGERFKHYGGDNVQVAITPGRMMTKVVPAGTAETLGDDVFDLITRTRGSAHALFSPTAVA